MKQTVHVAYGGVLTALSLVLLLLCSPASGWGLCMTAGMLPAIPLSCGRVRTGVMVYVATSILGVLLVPTKRYVAAYILLFGMYPMIKYAIECVRRMPLEWALKLLYAGSLLLVLYRLLGLTPLHATALPRIVVIPVGFAAFVCYDILFSKIIALFCMIFHRDQYNNKDKKG